MRIHGIILFSLSVLIGSSAIAADSDPLRVATTTSVRSSGLILNHRIDGKQLLIRHFTGVTGEELRFSTS